MTQTTKYYDNVTDDFVTSDQQDYQLPRNYQWEHNGQGWQLRRLVVTGVARAAGTIYLRAAFHLRWRNRDVLPGHGQGGYFLYANHTQPVGDPFIALTAGRPRGFAAIISPANLGIPVIGRVLPWFDALPIPHDLHGLARFNRAVDQRIAAKQYVTIFPEAHVWPYYTGIRPFSAAAFHYPVATKAPVYAMTTTYQKRRWGQRPRITVYIDGPFRVDATLPRKQQQANLAAAVAARMRERSRLSDYEYITYRKRG